MNTYLEAICNGIEFVAEHNDIPTYVLNRHCIGDLVVNGVVIVITTIVFLVFLSRINTVVDILSFPLVVFVIIIIPSFAPKDNAAYYLYGFSLIVWCCHQRLWLRKLVAMLVLLVAIVCIPIWYTRNISIIRHSLSRLTAQLISYVTHSEL